VVIARFDAVDRLGMLKAGLPAKPLATLASVCVSADAWSWRIGTDTPDDKPLILQAKGPRSPAADGAASAPLW
jgi:hypothetical protein